MKLGAKSLAGIGILVAAAIVWFATRPGPGDGPPKSGDGTAVVQQPSGRVVTAGSDNEADGAGTGSGADQATRGTSTDPAAGDAAIAKAPADDTKSEAGGGRGAKAPADDAKAVPGGGRGTGAPDEDPARADRKDDDTVDGANQEPGAPRFDLVRIDRDGQAVLAGRARPNQRVEILLDGEVIETVEADGAGAFVAIVETRLTGAAQNLQLRVPAPAGHAGAATGGDERAAETGSKADRAATADAGNTAAAPAAIGADSGGAPAPDDAPPRIAAATPDLQRPSAADATMVAGDAGAEVSREAGGPAPSAPSGPEVGSTEIPAQRAAPGRATVSPEVPGRTAPADDSARPGRPDRPVAGSRTGPAAAEAAAGSGSAPRAPIETDALAPSAEPGDLATKPTDDGKARPGPAERRVTSARKTPDTAKAAGDPGGAPSVPAETDTVARTPAPGDLAKASASDGRVRPGAGDTPVASTRTGPTAGEIAAVKGRIPVSPAAVTDTRFLTSAPVIILPGGSPDDAPTLLTTTRRDHRILQPSVSNINSVVLDRISYGETGDVLLSGRGLAGRAVRVYGNGLIIGTTLIDSDGSWALSVAQERGRGIKLLRMDELNAEGRVTTRIEAPFTYSRSSPKEVRERQVVVQKGDVLWRIAEQYYGAGLRYSVIYGANAKLIRDPDLIYPGQIFSVPELLDAVPER